MNRTLRFVRSWMALAVFGLVVVGFDHAHAQNLGTPRVRYDIHGGIVQTGNSALTCSGGGACNTARTNRAGTSRNNNFNMVYIDADNGAGVAGAAGTNQSSGASLSLPATGAVRWAGLYWMCQSNAAARNTVAFQPPGAGAYTTLTATQLMTGGQNNAYLGYADVTSTVRNAGAGTYWVGNMTCNNGNTNQWGGWNLIVVYEDLNEPLRDLVVWDGNQSYQTPALTLTLNGFVTPFSPLVDRVTDVGIFLGDGDYGQGDTLTLVGGTGPGQITTPLGNATGNVNLTTDVADSTFVTPYLPAQTRTPNYVNSLGMDLDVFRLTNRLPNGAQSASISALGSTNEVLFIGTVTFSTNIYAPDLVSTKTAVDLNGGDLLPGDELEYTIEFTNEGLDAALNTSLVDDLPDFTTLSTSPNAITYDGMPLTSANDADAATYDAGNNRVTVAIDPAQGGRVDTNESHTVTIRVVLAAGIPGGTLLSNQASFVYNGETLGNAVSYNSLSDGSTNAGNNPTDNPVTSAPRLSLVETATLTGDVDGQGDLDPGDEITFVLTATNSGNATATGVTLTDTLDTNLFEFVSVNATQGTQTGTLPGNPTFSVGSLNAGQSVVVTLVVRLRRPFPVGVTSASDQWSGSGSNVATVLSDDPSTAAANDPTTVQPVTSSCACFVGGSCFATGDLDPANSCQSCQPGTSQTAFSSIPDDSVCSVGSAPGSCHGGSCCTTCWNGSACVPGPVTCGVVCGDGQRVAGEECDDGNTMPGDGCNASCGIEGGFSCLGDLPNVCTPNVTILVPTEGSSTSDTTPTINGTAQPNSQVTVTEGANTLCTASVGASGAWSCTSSVLSLGGHAIVATSVGPGPGYGLGRSTVRNFSVIAPCGDGAVGLGELCDDGNTTAGDGCSATCQVESGYACTGTGPSVCTTGVIAITTPADGSQTSDTTPTITGTATPNSSVTVLEGSTTICTATTSASGGWSCDASPALALGGHTIVAVSTGPNPGDNGLSTPNDFTIIAPCGDGSVGVGELCDDGNTTAGDGCSATCAVEPGYSCAGAGPSVCTTGVIAITSPADGSQTTDTTPTITGTAKPNSSVTVFEGGMVVCTATTSASGGWSCDASPALALGGHTIVAVSTGPNPGDNGLSTETDFTIVTAPPCGDGVVGVGERCDDGNTTAGDGCSTTCDVEAGYSCAGAGPSVCTTGVITITTPTNGSQTMDTTPTIAGTAKADSTVTVYEGNVVVCTTTATSTGAWTCDANPALALGAHSVYARSAGPNAGDNGLSTNTAFTIVDVVSQIPPTILVPADGGTVSDPTPLILGRGEPGASITVREGATTICTATVDPSGTWACTPTTPFSNGAHTLIADQSKNGTMLQSSTVTFTLVPGALQSPTLVTPPPGSVIGITRPTLTGTAAPGSTVVVTEGGMTICMGLTSASGVWSCVPTSPLSEGPHALDLTSTLNGAMSTGGPDTIIVDLTAPTVDIVTPVDGSTITDATPTITGTTEADADVTVYSGTTIVCTATADSNGDWSCTPTTAFPEGPNTVRATATDAAGNVSAPDTTSFVLDTTGPLPPVITGPSEGAVLSNTRPLIVGTSEPGSTVVVTEGPLTICTATTAADGLWSCTPTAPLALGGHTVTATATDAFGNAGGSDMQSFSIDTGALSTPILTGPLAPVSNTMPPLLGTADPGSTVTVTDAGGATVCSGLTDASGIWSCVPTIPLTEGPNSLTLTATLGVLTSTPGTGVVVVDTSAPLPPTITQPGTAPIPNPRPTIGGMAEPGSTVTVRDEDGDVICTARTSPLGVWACVPTTPLPEGPTPITATSTDDAGNESTPATSTITVDTTAPTVTIATPVNGSTISDATPTVTGTTEPGADVTVTDDAGFLVCTATADASGAWSCDVPTPLVDGPHTLRATATDEAGNVSTPAQTVFIVDTSEPAEIGGLSGGALCAVDPGARSNVAALLLGLVGVVLGLRRARRVGGRR